MGQYGASVAEECNACPENELGMCHESNIHPALRHLCFLPQVPLSRFAFVPNPAISSLHASSFLARDANCAKVRTQMILVAAHAAEVDVKTEACTVSFPPSLSWTLEGAKVGCCPRAAV